jgi:hypothetical protein
MDIVDGHSDQYRPLGAYAALIGAMGAAVGTCLYAAARGDRMPERYAVSDLALTAVATYKLSRIASKDRVTSAIRAPFTRFQEDSGHGEVEEAARGRGLRRATGELLVCPNCLAQWVSAGFLCGMIAAPDTTRAVAALYTIYAAADALQLAHIAVKERAG